MRTAQSIRRFSFCLLCDARHRRTVIIIMEQDKNTFPEFHPIQTPSWLRRTGRFINHLVLGPHLFSPVSDHKFENTGGGPMLDRKLYLVRECPDIEGRDLGTPD